MNPLSQRDFDRRLDAFRAQVDLRACQPMASAPFWLGHVFRQSRDDYGVLALLGPTGIGIGHEEAGIRRYYPDPPTLGLLGLVSAARDHGQVVSVGCPPVARHLPLLLVATTAIAHTVQRQGNTESADSRGILVVSNDLEVRSRYCDLHVGTLPLEEAHPGSRLRPTGERVSITAGRDTKEAAGVCFYLPRGALPAKIDFRPALTVVDLRYARTNPLRLDELIEWVKKVRGTGGVIAMYSAGDTETAGRLSRAQFAHFELDHRAIRTSCASVVNDRSTSDVSGLELRMESASSFLEREHRIQEIGDAEQVEQLFANIGELLDVHSRVENPDLNRARWLLATMRQLPVPIGWYEQTAYSAGRQTLRNLINKIGVMSRHERLGAVLQSLRMQFDLLYREMERRNPRAIDFARGLPHLVASANGSLVLVRDRTTQRALRTWIDLESFRDADWTQRLAVLACPEFASSACHRYARVIICGVLPRRYRWIAGSALGDETYFLTYPHESLVIEQQLRSFYDPNLLDKSSLERSHTVASICGVPMPAINKGQESVPTPLRLQVPPKKKERPASKIIAKTNSLSGLADLVADAERREVEAAASMQNHIEASWRANDGSAETAEDISVPTPESDSDTMAYQVHVRSSSRGDGYVWLSQHQPVECVSPKRPNDLTLLPPDELEPGDVMLRLEEGGRADLFERIVDLAESQPELTYLGRFRREWKDALDRLAIPYRTREYVDYGAILRRLRENGATIQSALTVRNWIENYVIGPEDVRSIIAVGRAAELGSLVRNAKDFDRAFRRIRGIHQGIGRRLSTAIRQQFKNFARGQPEMTEAAPALDSRLGLPLEELLETVEYLQVLRVSDEPTEVLAAILQRFQQI